MPNDKIMSYDASDFGWAPGQWPLYFFDCGRFLMRDKEIIRGHTPGNFLGFVYTDERNTVRYFIYND